MKNIDFKKIPMQNNISRIKLNLKFQKSKEVLKSKFMINKSNVMLIFKNEKELKNNLNKLKIK